MGRTLGGAARASVRVLLVLAGVSADAPAARAQAWVPPGGIGVISVVYQNIDNTSHRLTDGSLLDGYDSVSRGVLFNIDYAVTDRWSFSVGLPYIGAKYTGPEPSFFGLPIDDCQCWNHGWQDLGATIRYNLVNGTFALTPSVSLGVPTHGYAFFGEAVLGRKLTEVRIAVDAGQRLDAISDRLSVGARYSYAIVEKVAELPNNRSNITLEGAFSPTRDVATRAAVSWQRSHGGLRSSEFIDELLPQFDRLIRDNNVHLSGGIAYSLARFDLFASYTHYVGGTDTHVGRAITVGVSLPFER